MVEKRNRFHTVKQPMPTGINLKPAHPGPCRQLQRAPLLSPAACKTPELGMVRIGGRDPDPDEDAGKFPRLSVATGTEQNAFHLIRGFRIGAQNENADGPRLFQAPQDFVPVSNDFHDS